MDCVKNRAIGEIEKYYTNENIRRIYGRFAKGHENGEFTVRMHIDGFFWKPRELFGVEKHLFAFYDCPDIMHDMNRFFLDVFFQKLGSVLDVLKPDVISIAEDLSGVNAPMISPSLFDDFVGRYYMELVPFLKSKGVRHVFVDTDGDFNVLIPNFIKAGIDGFLPMDVNAGMDIVKVREKYPQLKFIGAFNKLEIAKGKEGIDREFERLLPVIRQGGYIPGCDHQVAPSTSFADYLYYIDCLKIAMREAGKDI